MSLLMMEWSNFDFLIVPFYCAAVLLLRTCVAGSKLKKTTSSSLEFIGHRNSCRPPEPRQPPGGERAFQLSENPHLVQYFVGCFATELSYCRAEYRPRINRWCNYQIPPGQRLPSLYCTF